jgi:predicted dehydrogenase
MNNSKLKLAIIGAGYMAEEHIKALSDIKGVEIACIFSRTKSRAVVLANKYSIGCVYESITQMYTHETPDGVVVAVPELEVANVCSEVFKYPWISLIEKPVGYNYEDAVRISDAAKMNLHKGFVAFNRRHYSSTRILMNGIKKTSDLRLVHIFDQENQEAALAAGQPKLVVDNWMYANSIHLIDFFNLLCRGTVESIEKLIPWKPNASNFMITKINYSSGDIGIYEAVWNAPGPWSVTVNTRDNRWELRPIERVFCQSKNSRSAKGFEAHPYDINFKPGLRVQAEEFVRACVGAATNLPTLDDGVETMNLVKLIYGL